MQKKEGSPFCSLLRRRNKVSLHLQPCMWTEKMVEKKTFGYCWQIKSLWELYQ